MEKKGKSDRQERKNEETKAKQFVLLETKWRVNGK